jgi:hypothetical protein
MGDLRLAGSGRRRLPATDESRRKPRPQRGQSLAVSDRIDTESDERANCGIQRSKVEFAGDVVDIHFRERRSAAPTS